MPDKNPKYTMLIERTIVDDLGVKLYDKVSAVVAEIVANSYDADAEKVIVEVPLGKSLATHQKKKIVQSGYTVKIIDDGHGMTPREAQDFFLWVGRHRREHAEQGNKSRTKKRLVMGRKGLGKLAPFGVCQTIEVRSAGGKKTSQGYRVTHFKLEYEKILKETTTEKKDYHPTPLADDETWDAKSGTTITLRDFLPKKVPDKEVFGRQLSYRFGLGKADFSIVVKDTKEDPEKEFTLSQVDIPLMEGTRINLASKPVIVDSQKLRVTGWAGMSKVPYKNEEVAGVRIYVRGKIASVTRDFGLPSGFQGEFVARSYLVGEVHADWLDEADDLIQTHRQDILWSSELGQAFSLWGQDIIKAIAKGGREPRRTLVKEEFLKKSNLKEVAHERYNDPELEAAVMDLGEKIAQFASEEDIHDEDYVQGLSEIILTVAPHKMLIDVFKQIQSMARDGKIDVQDLVKLLQTAHIAQLASYGQIVAEKVMAIDVFEGSIRADNTDESTLQRLLEQGPWLIDPKWEPLTANQQFKSFRSAFESWYKKKRGADLVTSAILHPGKRPDFVFLHVESAIKLVEIKPPKHVFDDTDWKRLNNYDDAMVDFFKANEGYRQDFPNYFKITLIADTVKFKNTSNEKAFLSLKKEGRLECKTWEELLRETKQQHQSFLSARDSFPTPSAGTKAKEKPSKSQKK